MNAPLNPAARAVSQSAVFFDLSNWSVLHLFGRDAASFLHNFCTADIKGLKPGTACEAFITNVKARVVGHVFVMRWPEMEANQEGQVADEPRLVVFGSPGQGEKLAAHFDRYLIREEVTIENESATQSATYVIGPEAPRVVDAAARQLAGEFRGGPVAPADLAPDETTAVVFDNSPTMVARLDLFGRPGVLVLHQRQDRQLITDRLSEAGCAAGSPELLESLRTEACFPYYGVDITEDHLAPEVGRPWAISYTKGCYLGQEPIARIDALGHVNKLLRGVRLEDGPVAQPGAAVIAEGKEIGAVTSAAASLEDGKPVALAYLRSKFSEPGTVVSVRTDAGETPATVFGPRVP